MLQKHKYKFKLLIGDSFRKHTIKLIANNNGYYFMSVSGREVVNHDPYSVK